jgi:putative ABC transport system permease protein
MLIFRLALRNLLGSGLRTWLNVVVLSIAYVGLYGQIKRAQIETEYGGGQYWHRNYDPYDLLTIQDAHGPLPPRLEALIEEKKATPILVRQASIYPDGRIRTILLKGIDPNQEVLSIPSYSLKNGNHMIPALIGSRMAQSTELKIGDYVTLRWRDKNGTFDAKDGEIMQVMRTPVQNVDNNQIWIPLETMREMTGMSDEATLVVLDRDVTPPETVSGWPFHSQHDLLSDIREMMKARAISRGILYVILLFLAMLAIFNTQILSIFRRRKEMGTLMALGMTRARLIWLFTVEGAIHGLLAAGISAIYGIPLLTYFAVKGWPLPQSIDQYGIAIGDRLFPVYSAALILGTAAVIFLITTIVSYLPTRRIAKLKPTDALRGKMA